MTALEILTKSLIKKKCIGISPKPQNPTSAVTDMSESKKLFEDAKQALESNATEGQVEQSVVIPILKMLGYKENQIFNKVTVRVKAGSKKFESLQCDVLAKDDVLPTLVIEAKIA